MKGHQSLSMTVLEQFFVTVKRATHGEPGTCWLWNCSRMISKEQGQRMNPLNWTKYINMFAQEESLVAVIKVLWWFQRCAFYKPREIIDFAKTPLVIQNMAEFWKAQTPWPCRITESLPQWWCFATLSTLDLWTPKGCGTNALLLFLMGNGDNWRSIMVNC